MSVCIGYWNTSIKLSLDHLELVVSYCGDFSWGHISHRVQLLDMLPILQYLLPGKLAVFAYF